MEFLINVLTAFRAIILLICVGVIVVLVLLFRYGLKNSKVPKIIIAVLCLFGIAASAYLPARMFLSDKEFVPQYEMNDLEMTFKRFDEMFEYGTKRLNSPNVAASSENYLVFESRDPFDNTNVYDFTVFCYVSRCASADGSESAAEELKRSSADSGEKDGIKYWRSPLKCETSFPGGQFIWCVGSVLLENENGDSFRIEFQFRDYDDFNILFPSFPSEFKDLSMLTFDTVYSPWTLI